VETAGTLAGRRPSPPRECPVGEGKDQCLNQGGNLGGGEKLLRSSSMNLPTPLKKPRSTTDFFGKGGGGGTKEKKRTGSPRPSSFSAGRRELTERVRRIITSETHQGSKIVLGEGKEFGGADALAHAGETAEGGWKKRVATTRKEGDSRGNSEGLGINCGGGQLVTEAETALYGV